MGPSEIRIGLWVRHGESHPPRWPSVLCHGLRDKIIEIELEMDLCGCKINKSAYGSRKQFASGTCATSGKTLCMGKDVRVAEGQ